MKNSLKIFPFLLLAVMMLSVASCKDKKKEVKVDKYPPTEFESAMTNADTLAVKSLIDNFFTCLKDKRVTDAVAMLYRYDAVGQEEPEPLDNKDITEVTKTFTSIPVVDYRIKYIKFYEDKENEVLVDVIMAKAQDGQPEMSTKMNFKCINWNGSWLLCLNNTRYGDGVVIMNQDHDSISKVYKKRDAEREKAHAHDNANQQQK